MERSRRLAALPSHAGVFKAPFDLQPLESRLMLSKTILTPSNVLTLADREALLSEWNGPDKKQLAADLAAKNVTAFDNDLLSYMQTRTDANFYFQPGAVTGDLSYIQSQLNSSNIITQANDVVAHLFPTSANSTDTSTTQLASGNINWIGTGATSFYQALNRQAFWVPLAEAYRLTGNSVYATELTNELASWSYESPALANANSWQSAEPEWDLLGTSTRANNWAWTYSLMIGSGGWTAQANTLFLYKIEQTGDFLRAATPIAINDNRAILQYEGLVDIADLFPEFTNASDWLSYGHKELFRAMNSQIYPDGSDREQSPAYSEVVIKALLDTKLLDQDNNYTWPSAQSQLLTTAITAFEQMLSPNGDTAAIGDSYRESTAPLWLEADLVQGTTAFPAAKPRASDVLMFGTSVVSGYMSNPVTPNLPDRGLTYAEPYAGDYIFRSGSDPNATQVTFAAGPKGGNHGHYDLLDFELFGDGHPLISNPGMVSEAASAARTYAISTPAQNSISADGLNTADLEGAGNPGIVVDQWDPQQNSVQVTAHDAGYAYLSGSPTTARSIWYDYNGTMLVVDWAIGTASHDWTVAFNLPGTANLNTDDSIQSTNGDGDVKITPLLTSGKSFAAVKSFVSNTASPDESPAIHYTESQKGSFTAFANLITTYTGSTPPNVTATLLNTPTTSHSVTIALTENGVTQDIVFSPPHTVIPDAHGTVTASNESIAYDSEGQLHMAYYNPTTGHLYYTVRGTNGSWSPVQLVDDGPLVGQNPSLALDSKGNPGIAYYDATDGDLRYAYLDPSSNSWQIQTVDSYGTTGEFPSLAFSRHDGAVISYYDATHHELKLAQSATTGWTIAVVDHGADVGRYSDLSLDPSRPTASKWAISYDDVTDGTIKYAIQAGSGWTIATVGSGTGVTSLAFDTSLAPAIAYYDRKDGAVEVARYSSSSKTFSSTPVTNSGNGQDPNLFFSKKGVATVFFDSGTTHHVIEAVQSHSSWSETTLGSGGSPLDIARFSTSIAYTDGDAADNIVSVLFA
jgi:hypothetical protein